MIEGLLKRVLAYILNHHDIERNLLMAISETVQKLVNEIQANTSLVQSVKDGLPILSKQISDQTTQLSVLKALVDKLSLSGTSEEDIAAISTSVDNLHSNNTTLSETTEALKTAIPANTPEAVPADNPTP